MPEILFYDDPKTRLRTPYLKHALQRDLNIDQDQLTSADRHHFQSAVERNPNAIFIAENIGAKCHHMRDISSDSIKAMRQYAHDGGTLVLFGGAAHYAMKEIIWHWDNKTVVYKGAKEAFSMVHGTIIGPHHRLPLSFYDPIDHNGCFEVPLVIHHRNESIELEKCWQGNCGNFIISDDRIAQNYDILATYAQAGKPGVAAIDIPVGRKGGNIILCSVMPHYRLRHESPLWHRILTKVERKISRNPSLDMLKRAP